MLLFANIAASMFNGTVTPAGHVGLVQTTGQKKVMGGVGSTLTYTITPTVPFTLGNECFLRSSNYMDSGTNGRIAGVTFNGTAATKDIEHNDGVFSGAIWRGQSGGGSAGCVITLELTVGDLFYLACIDERDDYTGFDTTNSATGTSTAPAVAIASPAQNHEVFYSVIGGENNQNDTLVVPGGWTQDYLDSDGVTEIPAAAANLENNASGAVTATYSRGSSHNWFAIMAAYKLL
jgi:hypothetical protein